MKNIGAHWNWPHVLQWGPLVYVGARVYFALAVVFFGFPKSWLGSLSAFLIVVLTFWVNDKPLFGRANADNGPDNIYPGFAIFEVLNALPIPFALMLGEWLL